MRTRATQLAVAMKNCRIPPIDNRTSRHITGTSRRRCFRRTAMRPSAFQQRADLVAHADPAADGGADGRPHQPHLGEGAEAEDEAGVEHDVDDVRHPQRRMASDGVAGAAEDRVDEEEQHDGRAAAQDPGRVALASARPRSPAPPSGASRRPPYRIPTDRYWHRHDHAQGDGLHGRHRRAVVVALAHPARHHGRRRHAEAEGHREDRVSSDSVTPTAATASAPRRPTNSASRSPNTDSIDISRIIGIESRKTARGRLPVVKSCSPPGDRFLEQGPASAPRGARTRPSWSFPLVSTAGIAVPKNQKGLPGITPKGLWTDVKPGAL